MKKKYKVLGSSFKQYRQLSANVFELDNKENVITKENIEELINNFHSSKENIYFYKKHKGSNDEEREPIGQVIDLERCKNEIGLLANIKWNEGADDILSREGFYPSVEVIGARHEEANNKIFWNNLRLKAIASVEDPASKGVELLCASAEIIESKNISDKENNSENNKNTGGNFTMKEKIEELLKLIASGDKDAKRELVELIKKDPAVADALVEALSMQASEPTKEGEPAKEGEPNSEPAKEGESAKSEDDKTAGQEGGDKSKSTGEDDKVEPAKEGESVKEGEEKSLSANAWEEATEKYAKEKSGIKCSASSINKTFARAKKLYIAGESIEQCLSACKSHLDVLGISTTKQESVSLSALSEDEKAIEIAKMFEER